MIVVLEKTNQGEIIVVSAETLSDLQTQVETILGSRINRSTWTELLSGETRDCGQFQITAFGDNSVLRFKLKMRTIVNLDVQREPFHYSHDN